MRSSMLRLHWRRLRSRFPWLQILQTWRCAMLVCFIIILVWYMMLALSGKPKPVFAQRVGEILLGNIEFDFRTGIFVFKEKDDVYIRGSMPDVLREQGLPVHCGKYNSSRHMCVVWYRSVKLEVENRDEEYGMCQTIKWTPTFDTFIPQTCFSLHDASWYGGSLMSQQLWPLNKASLPLQMYISQNLETYSGKTSVVGNVLEWFWITSSGVTVSVDSSFPIKLSLNQSEDNLLCFHGEGQQAEPSVLRYTVCKCKTLKKAHRFILEKNVKKPPTLPGEGFFTKPSWATYPYLKYDMNQDTVLKFAKQIEDTSLTQHLLVIHDEDSMLLRQALLTRDKYPNAHQMLMYLKEYGFKVCLGVSPFVPTSEEVQDNFIMDKNNKPIKLSINNQQVNVVDLTNPSAFSWYVDQLKLLMENYGLDSFRFLGGESSYFHFSDHSIASTQLSGRIDTNIFPKTLSSVSEQLKITPLSSFGSSGQAAGGVIMLSSIQSNWGYTGGLQSVIPSVLTLGIIGYPFVIPNTVGGPGYTKMSNNTEVLEKPDKELYSRWLQLSAYLPCMMFSFPPWLYGDTMVEQARRYIKIHEDIVSPLVLKAAREYELTGAPIIRPIWWVDQEDGTALMVDDEFIIGDMLLVAPLLKKGVASRDIYLPRGKWRDNLNGEDIEGKIWLREFHVKATEIATFTRIHQTIS